MKNVRRLAFALSLTSLAAAAAFTAGCSGATQDQSPQTSASAMTKAPVAANAHGVVKMVGEALGEVPLRPDQRAELETIAADAEARHAALAAGHRQLMLAVADQIQAGAIDRAALQPMIDRAVADAEKARPADQAALARVHALLDADQRSAFVDALEAKMKAARGRARGEGFGRMKQLAADLKLTDDQRAQIKDVMKGAWQEHRQAMEHGAKRGPDFREQMKKGRDALEAFRGDSFDPSAFGPKDLHERAAAGADRIVGVAAKVLPLLTPEQRAIAAAKLRERAAQGPVDLGPPAE